MKFAKRVQDLPPYLFVGISRAIAKKKEQGIDVISFGIGDPDIPTPSTVIERLKTASDNPVHHRYPESEGLPEFRQAVAEFYSRRFGVNLDYKTEVINLIGAKEGIGKLIQTLKRKQMLGEGRYHDYRNDESMTPKQKIGRSMREIRDALNELDKTVKMNLKLKTELKMSSQDYWKNTHKALTKISERLVKMANKVGNMK